MLRLFQSIFGQAQPEQGLVPEEIVQMAIERAVDATDGRLRALPGYQKRLRPAVLQTIDHVVPRNRNGNYTWANLVTACPPCNRKKGGRTPQEANMHLLRTPDEPSASALYLYAHHLKHNEEWRDYVEGW